MSWLNNNWFKLALLLIITIYGGYYLYIQHKEYRINVLRAAVYCSTADISDEAQLSCFNKVKDIYNNFSI